MSDPRAVVMAFADAITKGDEAAAAAFCWADAWVSSHGDNPQRFFRKAADERRGFRVEAREVATGEVATGEVATGEMATGSAPAGHGDHAAVAIALFRRESGPAATTLAEMSLLGRPDSSGRWRIEAACKAPAWRDAYVRGQVPATLDYTRLPQHEDAANAVVALCALGARAKAGVGQASAMLTEWANEDATAARVILRLQHLIGLGYGIRVLDSRWLPNLGRAVVQAEVVGQAAGHGGPPTGVAHLEAGPVWLFAEVGPPLRWLRIEETLRAEAVAARAPLLPVVKA